MTLADFKISVHHIGGRSGTRPYPVFNWLEPEIVNVLYEADEACIPQIIEAWDGKCIVLPYCMGGSDTTASFNLVYDRYESSLLNFHPDLLDSFRYNDQFAYDTDPAAHRKVDVIPVTLRTLDTIFPHDEPPVPPPDFLSLDAEGAEYDILAAAPRLLRNNIHGVIFEFGFQRWFQGQKNFQEIASLLENQGFQLMDIHCGKLLHMKTCRPIGLRGRGVLTSGDALFLKSPENILDRHQNPMIALAKAALTGLLLGHLEYSLSVADLMRQYDVFLWLEAIAERHGEKLPGYLSFLGTFLSMVDRYPPIFPVRYSQLYSTPEAAAARFSGNPAERQALLSHCRPDPVRARYLAGMNLTEEHLLQQIDLVKTREYFGVEELFDMMGMQELADTVRDDRIQQVQGLMDHLGIVRLPGH
ncbi:MAG: FkbM family methyltransferase [Magnetococcales bacterium]|nr:FkbM family methyltransferase [Magnetococcales bacterium]